ncbi:MAG: cyclic nucleotide-binding domain-containing protein [Pseudomonadales bacterium]|nr:cyclic nucleotide-binding domain-containing protein [Pseudomonadales bacterium]
MAQPAVLRPADSSRVVQDQKTVVLVGQPPEILKNLLQNGISSFDAMLLTDSREKDGSLLNNLEFPFYFFVFVARGLAEGRKLTLVGNEADVSHALRLMRITLMGPTRQELTDWGTDEALKEEWLGVSEALALKADDGQTIAVEDFFEIAQFKEGIAQVGSMKIQHLSHDHYRFSNEDGAVEVELDAHESVDPPYKISSDYVPGGLVKLGVEVLGGASGFAVDEPCTGLALCVNGEYLLIDSIPFLDQHLFARGISKNQISAVFLTHLHDDHCAMFPLMKMPNIVEVITTREIFEMAMDKLACNLGWSIEVIKEHFILVEVVPGRVLNYYGLIINPHITVHSIPTIGAKFQIDRSGFVRDLCIVGDNNDMASVRELNKLGIVRDETLDDLNHLFTDPHHILIADGGAGAIHGDPVDALDSKAERVVFVHVEDLPAEFSNTFSLASSGKRYTIFDGDQSLYTSQVNHYLSRWLGKQFPNRWMRSLLAQEEIRRYNNDDVVVVQDSDSTGFVYLILTGYCNVVHHDGTSSNTIAQLQAGDLIGEMAVVTGAGSRNASVVAASPVTICVFSESIFQAFVETEGIKEEILHRWKLRPIVRALPQFKDLSSTVAEKVGRIAGFQTLASGQTLKPDAGTWYILNEGQLESNEQHGYESGWRPFAKDRVESIIATDECSFITFKKQDFEQLRAEVPQLNYLTRKQRLRDKEADQSWQLGVVSIY